MHASADPVGERTPHRVQLAEDLVGLRVVGHGVRARSGQHEVRVVQPRLLDEAAEDARGVLQRIPPRDLRHERCVRRNGRRFDQIRPVGDHRGHPIAPAERRVVRGRSSREQTGRPEDRVAVVRGEFDVLRGERVDARRDDVDLRGLEVVPDVRATGERDRVGGSGILEQEPPGRPREVVGTVDPDVIGPHDRRSPRSERRDQSERLRVVDDDDVARRDRPGTVEVAADHVVVVSPLRRPERAAVAEDAVQAVVDPLRDAEELGIPLEDQPPRRDTVGDEVAERVREQLRDATPARGRVDVPDRAAGERPTPLVQRALVAAPDILPRDRAELVCVTRRDGDLEHREGGSRGRRLRFRVSVRPPG